MQGQSYLCAQFQLPPSLGTSIKHDHILAGYFRQNKTITLICCQCTWPRLQSSIINFCKSCTTCTWGKAPKHKPYGILQQLPIPEQPWNSISMDFIEKLPESSGYTAILIVVDWLTKQTIFILTHNTITSPQLTELFILMSFPSMESCPTLHLIVVLSLFPISSNLLGKPLICDYISHWVIILKAIGRLNEWTKLSNSISRSIAVINRTIGLYCFPSLNSLTTMPQTWPPVSLPSLPIKDTTWTSLFILTEIFHPLMPENLLLILISFTKNCTHGSQLHRNITKAPQILNVLPCQTSKLDKKS